MTLITRKSKRYTLVNDRKKKIITKFFVPVNLLFSSPSFGRQLNFDS